VAPEMDDKNYAAHCIVRQEPDRAADDASPGIGPSPKMSNGRRGIRNSAPPHTTATGRMRLPVPSKDGKKEVEEPDHDGASEDKVRIAQGCLKRPTTRAHGDVAMRAATRRTAVGDHAKRDRNGNCIPG